MRAPLRIFALLWLLLALATPAWAVTLADLDAILAKAPTLQAFLASKPLQDELYEALKVYYGKYLSRADFDEILRKTGVLAETVDGFAAKAWSAPTASSFMVPFTIESQVQTHGRNIAPHAWDTYVDSWKKRLRGAAATALDVNDNAFEKDQAEATARRAKDKLFAIQKELLGLKAEYAPKLAGLARAARLPIENERDVKIRAVLARTDVQGLVAYLVLQSLETEAVRDVFQSRDADLVLDSLKTWRDKPRTLTGLLGDAFLVSEYLVAEVRRHLPNVDDLLETTAYATMRAELDRDNRERFPIPQGTPAATAQAIRGERSANRAAAYERFNKGKLFPLAYEVEEGTGRVLEGSGAGLERYEFVPIPRRILGFMDGEWLGECVSTHMERFAVDALDDVAKHHVRRRQSFLGFTRVVPVKHKDTVIAPVEFGAPVLRQKAFAVAGGEKFPTTFYELWLDAAFARKPPHWTNFVVGTSSAINNAGVQDTVRKSPTYVLRSDTAHSKDVTHVDAMATAIAGKDTRAPHGYGGRLITEGTVGGQGHLRPIRPFTPDEMDALVRGDGRLDAILPMLRQARFATSPRAGEWGDVLVERVLTEGAEYEHARTFVKEILSQESWARHPKAGDWVARLLEIPSDFYNSSKDPVALLVQETFAAPHWAKHAKFATWVYQLIDSGRGNLVTSYLLQREAVLEHPEAYAFLIRAGIYDEGRNGRLPEHFASRHLELLLANTERASGVLTADQWHEAAALIFEANRIGGALGTRTGAYTFGAAFEKTLLAVAQTDDDAWHTLVNLAFDIQTRFQRPAMALVLREGEKETRRDQMVAFAAQYFVRRVATRPRDAREILNAGWESLARMAADEGTAEEFDRGFDSGDFLTAAGVDPYFYENAKDVMAFVAKNWRQSSAEGGLVLALGLEAVFKRMAFDTVNSSTMEGLGAFMLGRKQENPAKLELARQALLLLTEMALEEPIILRNAWGAIEHALKVNFQDGTRLNDSYRLLVDEYPDFFVDERAGLKDFAAFLPLVKRRHEMIVAEDQATMQARAEAIVQPYPHLFLNAHTMMLRQVALLFVMEDVKSADPAKATHDVVRKGLERYRANRGEEYEQVCAMALAAQGTAESE